jgi:hypothetical protein
MYSNEHSINLRSCLLRNSFQRKFVEAKRQKLNLQKSFTMQLEAIPVFESLEPKEFKDEFYDTQKPVVIKNLARNILNNWLAIKKLVFIIIQKVMPTLQ